MEVGQPFLIPGQNTHLECCADNSAGGDGVDRGGVHLDQVLIPIKGSFNATGQLHLAYAAGGAGKSVILGGIERPRQWNTPQDNGMVLIIHALVCEGTFVCHYGAFIFPAMESMNVRASSPGLHLDEVTNTLNGCLTVEPRFNTQDS